MAQYCGVTDPDTNWKKHLLKTSVPLEYQAAIILSKQEFGVSSDYSYHRLDGSVEKEFSVDVRGVKGAGGLAKPGAECLLDLFVECKYRERGASWLFLPTPKYHRSDFDRALQSVDYFSLKFVHPIISTTVYELDECFTGVEVGSRTSDDEANRSKGRAIESQLRHGARQLQYALPSLVALRARVASLRPPQETFPFFFAAVLVTNAPLIVANDQFGIAAVEAAKTLQDIGKEVPFLLWSYDLGPDFQRHCQRELAGLAQVATSESMRTIETHRGSTREAKWLLPSALARSIAADPGNVIHIADFEKVLIVNIDHLSAVVQHLTERFGIMATSLKDEPFVKW